MGAERIIVIETVAERVALAKKSGATDIIDFDQGGRLRAQSSRSAEEKGAE